MIFRNLQFCGEQTRQDIHVEGDKISAVQNSGTSRVVNQSAFNFDGALAFPGLINSHDHLDFNLFERLGSRIYPNYVEWANHLQQAFSEKIAEITAIPLEVRIAWGMYKNLLNGFTTVVNHGRPLPIPEPIMDVLQPANSLHSIRLEKNWQWKVNRPSIKKKSFAIHVGEGIDEESNQEIDRLLRNNYFNRELIGIHGVAMTAKQAEKFKALVWCPASNHFLLGQTAPVNQLASHTNIVFGTDSTLTTHWNAWTHIREARSTGMSTDQELFAMLTTTPARIWNLPDQGVLQTGNKASLVIAKNKKTSNSWDAFFELNPEDILLIIHRGSIRLFDEELKKPLEESGHLPSNFNRIKLGGSFKFAPQALYDLAKHIREFNSNCLLPFSI